MGLSTVFDEVSQCLLRSSGYAVNLLVKLKLGLVLDQFELVVFDWVKKYSQTLVTNSRMQTRHLWWAKTSRLRLRPLCIDD